MFTSSHLKDPSTIQHHNKTLGAHSNNVCDIIKLRPPAVPCSCKHPTQQGFGAPRHLSHAHACHCQTQHARQPYSCEHQPPKAHVLRRNSAARRLWLPQSSAAVGVLCAPPACCCCCWRPQQALLTAQQRAHLVAASRLLWDRLPGRWPTPDRLMQATDRPAPCLGSNQPRQPMLLVLLLLLTHL